MYDKSFEKKFRKNCVLIATITPGIFILIDMMLNKIKIPFKVVFFNLVFSIYYILITFIGQILIKYPVYPN